LTFETEEEIAEIEAMEVPIMQQAIEACRSITPEFLEIERKLTEDSIIGLGVDILCWWV